jgi:hypothetical protein
MADPGKETRIIDILERSIVVRELTEGQMLVLSRYADQASSDRTDPRTKVAAVSKMLTVLEQAVVQAEDRQFLEDQMIAGNLDLGAMTQVVSVFQQEKPKNRATRRATSRS